MKPARGLRGPRSQRGRQSTRTVAKRGLMGFPSWKSARFALSAGVACALVATGTASAGDITNVRRAHRGRHGVFSDGVTTAPAGWMGGFEHVLDRQCAARLQRRPPAVSAENVDLVGKLRLETPAEFRYDPQTGDPDPGPPGLVGRADRGRLDLQELRLPRVLVRTDLPPRRLLLRRHQQPGPAEAARVRPGAARDLPRRGHAHDHAEHVRRSRVTCWPSTTSPATPRSASVASTSTTCRIRPTRRSSSRAPATCRRTTRLAQDPKRSRTARTRSSSGRTAAGLRRHRGQHGVP